MVLSNSAKYFWVVLSISTKCFGRICRIPPNVESFPACFGCGGCLRGCTETIGFDAAPVQVLSGVAELEAEDVVGGQDHHFAALGERIEVEVGNASEYGGVVGAAFYVFLLEGKHIVECGSGQSGKETAA